MARRKKKPVHKVVMTEGKRQIIQQLLQEYDIETAEDIQDALKDLLGGIIKEMMEAEMDNHLGYEKIRALRLRRLPQRLQRKNCQLQLRFYADRCPTGPQVHI